MINPQLLSRLVTATVVFGSCVPLSAANLLDNGDFLGGGGGDFATGSATGGGNSVPAGWTGFATGNGSLALAGDRVNFNGADQPTGSYIEQSVTTETNRWYVLDWEQSSHTGADAAGAVVSSTLASGGSSTTGSYRGLASPSSLILTGSTTTTVRLSDAGASTTSLDTRIGDVSFDLANGQLNVAHLASLSSDSQYFAGAWGNEENAVDGRVGGADNTVFHNNDTTGGFLELDFTTNFTNATFDRIEIEARPGFSGRKGDTIDIFSTSGSLIESIDITGADGDSSFGVDGSWSDVGRIRVTENGQFLNVAEVRTFSTFVDGQVVPEPASVGLLALGGMTFLLRRRR